VGIFTPTVTKMVRKRYGSNYLSPQMSEVEALVTQVELARAEQIERMPKTSDDLRSAFPSADAAFQAIFSVAIGSGRLDAVIDCQDFIGEVAMGRIDSRLSEMGYDNGFAIIAIQTLVALYMRDWMGRKITDEQFAKFNEPPHFDISSRSFSQSDYQDAVAPWVTVFGKVHPSD
jgi:hypothetical protein